MAGLLDFASDPQGMQGLALLAAAGPSMEPANFASRLALAGRTYQGLLGDQINRQLGQAHIDALTQQTQLGGLQLEQAQQQWALQQPLLQGLVGRLSAGSQSADATPSQPAIPPMQGGGLGSGTFGMSVGGQSASAPTATMGASGGSTGGGIIPGVPDDVTRWTVATGGLKGIPALMTEYNKPTDFQKMLTAAGVDPQSPLGRQLIQQNLAKQNYIAPVNARPGSILRDPNTNQPIAFNPHIPDGSTPTFDASGNVIGLRPLNGAYPAIAAAETAKGMGAAEATPTVAYDASGNPVFSTKATDVRRAGGGLPGSSVPLGASQDQFAILMQERDKAVRAGNAGDVAAIDREISRLPASARGGSNPSGLTAPPAASLTPVPKLGAQQAATLSQEDLGKRWSTLQGANSEAQNTRSYLESIKQLADTAATGPFTNKVQFTNALLALVGNEKATDATTANALLDKYSGQIVARLGGSGGLATDSARALLQSAYPNAHMTPDAIREAADNLIGAQGMVQAKTRLLQNAATQRNPSEFTRLEVQFDQNADPRIWQLQNMDAKTAQKYLSKLPPQVQADLRKRVGNLKMIGAL